MAKQIINLGTGELTGDGESIRSALDKVNDNFDEVYPRVEALEDGNITSDVVGSVFGDDSTLLVDGVNSTIPYPANAGVVWDGNAPTTVDVALDRLAAYTQNSPSLTGDFTGSVFGDDSTVLVDGVNNKIVGAVDTASLRTSDNNIALGNSAGFTNQGAYGIALGFGAGDTNQGVAAIGIGYTAGQTSQGAYGIALGMQAGNTSQGISAVAIGEDAGLTNQGAQGVAIGNQAGNISQTAYAVAIGVGAGYDGQKEAGVAIGQNAGYTTQGIKSVAIGHEAGKTTQGAAAVAVGYQSGYAGGSGDSVAIGHSAGYGEIITTVTVVSVTDATNINVYIPTAATFPQSQHYVMPGNASFTTGQRIVEITGYVAVAGGSNADIEFSATYDGTTPQPGDEIVFTGGQDLGAVAIGKEAGYRSQRAYAVAIGRQAGHLGQDTKGVAIGDGAGRQMQNEAAVAVGAYAGYDGQGISAVAIGEEAGKTSQGANAIAIGEKAGYANQAANSIVINATGIDVYNFAASSLVITPIRSAAITTILGYDADTGEVTHNAAIPGYTNTADLKALVAASTDFADYQTRIAAL